MITPMNNIFGVDPYLQRKRNTNCMNDQAYAFYCHVVNLHSPLTIHSRKSGPRCLGHGVTNITYEKIETRGGSGGLYYAFLGITCTTLKDRINK